MPNWRKLLLPDDDGHEGQAYGALDGHRTAPPSIRAASYRRVGAGKWLRRKTRPRVFFSRSAQGEWSGWRWHSC